MAMTSQPRLRPRRFPLSGGYVEAYWRDDVLAKGPCLSLHVGDVELMRFDLDPNQPHEHWNVGAQERIYYPPTVDLLALAEANLTARWQHAAQLAGVTVGFTTADLDEAAAEAVAYLS